MTERPPLLSHHPPPLAAWPVFVEPRPRELGSLRRRRREPRPESSRPLRRQRPALLARPGEQSHLATPCAARLVRAAGPCRRVRAGRRRTGRRARRCGAGAALEDRHAIVIATDRLAVDQP